jgi:hypothetical protein
VVSLQQDTERLLEQCYYVFQHQEGKIVTVVMVVVVVVVVST